LKAFIILTLTKKKICSMFVACLALCRLPPEAFHRVPVSRSTLFFLPMARRPPFVALNQQSKSSIPLFVFPKRMTFFPPDMPFFQEIANGTPTYGGKKYSFLFRSAEPIP
jgi:hypothetical protein